MSEARRAHFEARAKRYFPKGSITDEERQKWVDGAVNSHPVKSADVTFRPDNITMLFQRQGHVADLLKALSDAMALSHGELIALLAKYYEQDGLTQAAILSALSENHKSEQDSANRRHDEARVGLSVAFERLEGVQKDQSELTRSTIAVHFAELKVLLLTSRAKAEINEKSLWNWRYLMLSGAVILIAELGVMLLR